MFCYFFLVFLLAVPPVPAAALDARSLASPSVAAAHRLPVPPRAIISRPAQQHRRPPRRSLPRVERHRPPSTMPSSIPPCRAPRGVGLRR